MIKKKKEKIQLDHNNIWFCSKLPAEGFKPSYPSSKIMNYVSTLKCALVVMLGVQANLVHDRAAGERYCQEFCQDVLEHNPAWTVEFHITCRCRKDSDRSSTAVIGSNCELCSSEGDFCTRFTEENTFPDGGGEDSVFKYCLEYTAGPNRGNYMCEAEYYAPGSYYIIASRELTYNGAQCELTSQLQSERSVFDCNGVQFASNAFGLARGHPFYTADQLVMSMTSWDPADLRDTKQVVIQSCRSSVAARHPSNKLTTLGIGAGLLAVMHVLAA